MSSPTDATEPMMPSAGTKMSREERLPPIHHDLIARPHRQGAFRAIGIGQVDHEVLLRPVWLMPDARGHGSGRRIG